MRTIPDFGQYLNEIEEVISGEFLPAIFGDDTPAVPRACLALPTSRGGLGVEVLPDIAENQFEASRCITQLHTDSNL